MEWIKSGKCTRSTNCVEVAFSQSFVHVRTSDNSSRVLDFTYDEWRAFTEGAKLGEFDI